MLDNWARSLSGRLSTTSRLRSERRWCDGGRRPLVPIEKSLSRSAGTVLRRDAGDSDPRTSSCDDTSWCHPPTLPRCSSNTSLLPALRSMAEATLQGLEGRWATGDRWLPVAEDSEVN